MQPESLGRLEPLVDIVCILAFVWGLNIILSSPIRSV